MNKRKPRWRFYFLIILASIFLGTFIFVLLIFTNQLPIKFPSFPGVEEYYTSLFKLSILIPLVSLAGIFSVKAYLIIHNRKISKEIENEKGRIKNSGKSTALKKSKESEKEPEAPLICECGEKLPPDAMFCSKCGKEM